MDKSSGYLPKVIELLNKIETEQYDNIRAAAKLMADAIENDRLINVYGGGGHTTLPVGEMFFRAGGATSTPAWRPVCPYSTRRRSIWRWSAA